MRLGGRLAGAIEVLADIEGMNPKWVRGGYIKSFGPVLFIGVGLPIPILNSEIAEYISITDDKIHAPIVDFSIPRRTKPILGECTYSELRTSTIMINGKPTLAAPLSSMAWTIEMCKIFKDLILRKDFYLTKPIIPIDMYVDVKKLDSRIGELV